METILKYLFRIVVIVWCLLTLNIDCSFLIPVLYLALFVLIIGGGIYAVAYALGETRKYRNEVEKEELNKIDNVETEK